MKDSRQRRITRSFFVTGMTCATCSRMVERALQKVDGVAFSAVNLATETAFVVLDYEIPQTELERVVEDAGYGVSYETAEDLEARRYGEARRNLLISWVVTLPLMVLMLHHMAGRQVPGFLVMELVGGVIVIAGAGWRSLRGAWIALSHAHANMDVLIVLGSLAAWLTALLRLMGVPIVSFGAIGPMIVAIHVTGRYIESWLRDRASREIRALLKIQAREARMINDDGEEIMVPIEAVKENFLVLVHPGERIPVDGDIVSGSAAVDESMISGEPIPAEKKEGDSVTGGSIDVTGVLRIRTSRVGEDSFLAQMIALIQEAQGAKIPIQALADRITNYFVPLVTVLAIVSGTLWFLGVDRFSPLLDGAARFLPWVTGVRDPLSIGVFAFVTTIVIACPCALGLATPMALITGTGMASGKGLIIRNAEAIQTARDVGTVIVDKTGTLTEGCPVVVEHDLDGEAISHVAAVERYSNHPLARAISNLSEEGPVPEEVEEVAGEGIRALVDGRRYFIGRPEFLGIYSAQLVRGRSIVEVRVDGKRRGFLALEDPIREDAVEAVERLLAMGIHPVMATGDNERTARIVAGRLGIEEVFAGIHPRDKLDIVRRYQAEGRKVLMVGDGMNDAAALKGADIGVAVGSGTDLAIDSADVVLVRGGISGIADAVTISRRTLEVIRQNLFWAFAYNLVAIPMAMSALLHPVIAELAMAFSSISVILNSMRIGRRF